MARTTVVGADGAPGGWAVAGVRLLDGRVEDVALSTVAAFAEVLALASDAVGVDMPVGLPARGRRECDLLAKRRLGTAHARVFLTPPRAVLGCGTHAEASALHRTLVDGRGMSVQTWHLLGKVAEVDAVADDPRVVEVHPELSFAALVGTPLPPKRTPEGRAARLAALAPWAGALDVPRGTDHLDALAVAWTAWRWSSGAAEVLPADPPHDERGRPMRIVV
jgi:predicted RNase H-like nuclease